MVKHTQTIRRLLPTNCLSVFDHFMGLALKGLRIKALKIDYIVKKSYNSIFSKHTRTVKDSFNSFMTEAPITWKPVH